MALASEVRIGEPTLRPQIKRCTLLGPVRLLIVALKCHWAFRQAQSSQESRGQCGSADCHEAGSRTDSARLTPARSSPLLARRARACSVFLDERRVVAYDDGGWMRTRNAHSASSGSAALPTAVKLDLERIAPFTSACSSPVPLRCARAYRAFADERRIVVGDEGGRAFIHSFEWPPTSSTFRPFDPVREAGAQTEGSLARSSPPPVAPRPRVAARSPMSGASWPATKAEACGRLFNSQGRRSSTSGRSPVASLAGRRSVGKLAGHRAEGGEIT